MAPLIGPPFDEFAPLYEAAATRGISPQVVDDMEIWQLASVLGLAKPPDPRRTRGRGAMPIPRPASGRDLIAERVAAARGDAPPPRPDRADSGVAALLEMTQGG